MRTQICIDCYTAKFQRCQGLQQMKIKFEGLQTWVKTRWVSLYVTVDSILRAVPVFDILDPLKYILEALNHLHCRKVAKENPNYQMNYKYHHPFVLFQKLM